MKKLFFGALLFLLTCSLFAQTDMGQYREIQINNDLRIYIIKSQRCADFDSVWDFWSNNAFLWAPKWIINNQQHFDTGVAYIFRTVTNIDNQFRLISQRLIYFTSDKKTVYYFYCLDSIFEPY
jgi:hypothetical protein